MIASVSGAAGPMPVGAVLDRIGGPGVVRLARTVVLAVSGAFASARRRASRPQPAAAEARSPGRGSFEETVLPHLDAAYNLARFLTREPDAADDIVQEAFLRAFRSFEGFRGGDPRAWLLAIVRNGVRDWASERGRERARLAPLAGAGEDGEEAERVPDRDRDTPAEAVLRGDEAALVRRTLEGLPEIFREVLVLREFDDLSYREIAEVTVVPIGTVMSRLARARALFGAAWRRHGGDERP
ncbi:sigma-70 family RNA polymerase sigma factor [Methylobacterium sp. sgz302541]|uniref:sigma-70 family RNA polymerase sigma factor n=1 Tax=unclassified Methylobacterium TaxID=2615210 RepID=UPI003D342C25